MGKKHVFELQHYPLTNDSLLLNETLFHNANGYIGIRYAFEEGYPEGYESVPGQYINGVYDILAVNQAESLYGLIREKQTMLNVANTQGIRVVIGNEEFSMFHGTVLESTLTADMDRGTTVRDVLWQSPDGKELRIRITRMASFHQLPLFTIDYELTPLNFSDELIIESTHNGYVTNYVYPDDPRTADTCTQYLIPVSSQISGGAFYIKSRTTESGLDVCTCVKHVISKESEQECMFNDNQAICKISTSVRQNEKIRLIKYAVFCDSVRYEDCRTQAAEEMEKALSVSLETLYEKQEEYLADYWERCFVEIEDGEELDTALQYNLYQLIQSVGKDPYSSIAPKGLSGEGYEGHYFWDSEMYIQPYFTITNPSFSKKLIEYRYTTLQYARENAARLGHARGARYPWRTIMGKECSGYFPAGSAQYHINGDIAYSIIAYYLATKDLPFILEKGAEVLFETARLWLDIGNFHEGKFLINGVTGPDEYTCMVNNNYYTNVLAQYHLRWAVKFYEMLRSDPAFGRLAERIGLEENEIEQFEKAAGKMYLPYDPDLKINPQDDSFLQKEKLDLAAIPRENFPLLLHYHPLYLYRHQVCKQPDTVLAHFILEDAQPENVILNSYLYYEKITTHDSSLSQCIFSIMAARLGMEEKAFNYFRDAVFVDLSDLKRNTRDGIHAANMGGNYMSIVYGFAGFRLKESGISFAPILPREWSGYRFRICIEDRRILVHIKRTECFFHLEDGEALDITVYGKTYRLDEDLTVARPQK